MIGEGFTKREATSPAPDLEVSPDTASQIVQAIEKEYLQAAQLLGITSDREAAAKLDIRVMALADALSIARQSVEGGGERA